MIAQLVWLWVGVVIGALTVALVAARTRPAWDVTCGRCRTTERKGPRRQLYLELWGNDGVMYDKWMVGRGEMLGARPVDFGLLQDVRGRVTQVNDRQSDLRLG